MEPTKQAKVIRDDIVCEHSPYGQWGCKIVLWGSVDLEVGDWFTYDEVYYYTIDEISSCRNGYVFIDATLRGNYGWDE